MRQTKSSLVLSAMATALLLSACSNEKDYYNPQSNIPEAYQLSEFFNFKTTMDVQLNVDYGTTTSLVFQLFEENPWICGETGSIYFDSSASPLATVLAKDGKCTQTITLPSSLEGKTVYAFTGSIGVPQVLAGTISNGKLTLNTSNQVDAVAVAQSRSAVSRAFSGVPTSDGIGCNTILTLNDNNGATWNNNGTITSAYVYANMAQTEWDYAKTIIDSYLKEKQKPVGFLMGEDYHTDLIFNPQKSEVTVTFVYGNTGAQSTLAYYCYDGDTFDKLSDDEKKTYIEALPKCVLFASSYSDKSITTPFGTTVRLKYIDANGNKSDDWQKGTRIGFVNYNNSWKDGKLQYAHFSTPIGDIQNGTKDICFTNSSTLTYTNNGTDHVMLGIDDWKEGDGDFNDLVLEVHGVFSTTNIETNEIDWSSKTRNVLGFEDNWPSRGDYDLNDVVIRYEYQPTFIEEHRQVTEVVNGVTTAESKTFFYKSKAQFTFELLWTGAEYSNGFGFEFTPDADADLDNITINGNKVTGNSLVKGTNGKCILYLFTNARQELDVSGSATAMKDNYPNLSPKTYTVVIPYKKVETEAFDYNLAFNPFINPKGLKTKEVHLIDNAPTSAGTDCAALFGSHQSDAVNMYDTSNPANGEYYRSSEFYPFAVSLNADGINNADVWDVDLREEATPIYITFPSFTEWAKYKNSQIRWWE